MAVLHTFDGRDGLVTKKITAGKAIRAKCLECSNFSYEEVRSCQIKTCALYPFRFGKDPSLKGKRGNAEALKRYHEGLKQKGTL